MNRDPNEPTSFVRKPGEDADGTGPPMFGRGVGRWSINSGVRVYWWSEGKGVAMEERSGEGSVIGLHKNAAGEWIVTIDFGPVWNEIHQREFRPSQVEAL